tara:strand:+ start:263 stop:1219 length:957 start_codon:yes stop_codon:yes gene_type:complete
MINYFSESFENFNNSLITETIKKDSFFALENAVNKDTIEKILSEADLFNIKINSIDVSSVHADDGYYLSNGLAKSETLYNFLTSEKIMKIAKSYLGEKFRLKCHRIYSVSPGARNPWHTDDKKYGTKIINGKGLVFMIYLNDVYDGEFQAIKGSHLYSSKFKHSNFDEDVIKDFTHDITSFKHPMGSIIIFDNKTIHRAKPYYKYLWKRKSLFFQIDNEIDDGEKIIINSRFIKKIDENIINYLGIGKPANMPHEPANTSINSLNYSNIFNIQKKIFITIIYRTVFLLKSFLRGTFKRKIQKILGKKNTVNSKINIED